jgi:hypothetical protein
LKIDLDNKKVFTVIIVLIAIAIISYAYYKIFFMYRENNIFARESEKYAEEVNNPIFRINKVLVYSDANVEDLSENQDLSNINISQFTDFAIYIDNFVKSDELSAENTINKIYISDIGITDLKLGEQKVNYKSLNDLCKYTKINEGVSQIDYKVLHTNEEKALVAEENVFFTDCSEPLVMSYENENVVQKANLISSGTKLSLDGSILKLLQVSLDDLNYTISFTVNIENNLGDEYACDVSLDIDLNSDSGGIFTGYIMQVFDLANLDYRFKKTQ